MIKGYKYEQEPQTKKWIITAPNMTLMGTEFFIVCENEENAKKLTNQLNEGKLENPIQNNSIYEEIKEYTPMDHRKFWRFKT